MGGLFAPQDSLIKPQIGDYDLKSRIDPYNRSVLNDHSIAENAPMVMMMSFMCVCIIVCSIYQNLRHYESPRSIRRTHDQPLNDQSASDDESDTGSAGELPPLRHITVPPPAEDANYMAVVEPKPLSPKPPDYEALTKGVVSFENNLDYYVPVHKPGNHPTNQVAELTTIRLAHKLIHSHLPGR